MVDVNASSVLIEELPSGGRAGRSMTLVGGALPKWLAAWPVKPRVVTTYFSGNSQASQQVLGPIDMPSTWDFVWSRTVLSRRAPVLTTEDNSLSRIVHPHILYETLESFARRSLLLRVTWTTFLVERDLQEQRRDVKIVRYGRISAFEPSVTRAEDIECKITFDWVGRGAGQARSQPVRDAGVEESAVRFQQSITGIEQATLAFSARPPSTKKLNNVTLAQFAKFSNTPQAAMEALGRTVRQISGNITAVIEQGRTLVLTPVQVADAMAAIAQNTIAVIAQTKRRLTQTPPEVASLNQRSSDVARSARHLGEVNDAMTAAFRAAEQMLERARRISAPLNARDASGAAASGTSTGASPTAVQKVHVVHQGETLVSISKLFYGTGEEAAAIARANHLPWHQVDLPPGMLLVIPASPQKQH